jgi:hypothetical protein
LFQLLAKLSAIFVFVVLPLLLLHINPYVLWMPVIENPVWSSDRIYTVKHVTDPVSHQIVTVIYVGVSKSFRTGRLERELQMVQLSAAR